MSLTVLVALVAVGIALVVVLVHLSGGSARAPLGDEAAVIQRFRLDFPDSDVHRCFESADRYEALLLLGDGSLGLVHAFGDKSLTRHYSTEEFATIISVIDDASLTFDAHEMTLPRLTIRFENAQRRAEVLSALGLPAVSSRKAA